MTIHRKVISIFILYSAASFIAEAASPAATGIFRAGSTLAVIDVNGDGTVNYNNLPPDEVFYYPVAADQTTTGDLPVSGDWNGDGRSKIGVFRHDGAWFLDANGDGVLDSGDLIFQYTATLGDIPVVGDWNHNGRTKTGIFRNGQWILDVNGDGVVNYSNLGVDMVFQYTATAGDVPVVGDWNGDGRTKTGIYRTSAPGTGLWVLDANGDGVVNYPNLGADMVFQYTATAGDVPVVGDWSGNGHTKTGVFRSGAWILDANGDGVFTGADFVFQYTATTGDVPVVGDWNGNGRTKTGIFRTAAPGAGLWVLDANGDGTVDYNSPAPDLVYQYSASLGDLPVIGAWTAANNQFAPFVSFNGGASIGNSPPGTSASFAFTYRSANGANDVAWGQVMLTDPSGNVDCALSWGRPSALALYDGGADGLGASTTNFGVALDDGFCAVSLASIMTSTSDPNAVTVTLNFTFAFGYSGTYGVSTQVNDLVGGASS